MRVSLRPAYDLGGSEWLSSLRQGEHDNAFDGMQSLPDNELPAGASAANLDVPESPTKFNEDLSIAEFGSEISSISK